MYMPSGALPVATPVRWPSRQSLLPGLIYSEETLLPPAVTDSVVAVAGRLWVDPGTCADPWYQRSSPRPDWSKITVMTHVVPVQKESWTAAFAEPPAASTPILRVVLSDDRRTWYRSPP